MSTYSSGHLPGCTGNPASTSCLCFEERAIQTLEHAQEVFKSGRATWKEWSECAQIFVNHGLSEESVECIVRAVLLIRDPKTGKSGKNDFLALVAQYLQARASQIVTKPTESQYWLLRLANQIRADLRGRLSPKKAVLADYLDPEISQMLLLAASDDKFSQTRLAAKLRNQNPYESQIRWGQPEVAKGILDEIIGVAPADTFALVCRSATHIDLGNITDGLKDAERALELDPDSVAARTALASAYLAGGQGIEAVNQIAVICAKVKPNIALVCMVYAACAFLESEDAENVRTFAEGLRDEIDPDWSLEKSQSVVEVAALKVLCAQRHYLQALQLLAELDREGWRGNTSYWEREISKRARLDPNPLALPDLQSLKENPQDFFPNHK